MSRSGSLLRFAALLGALFGSVLLAPPADAHPVSLDDAEAIASSVIAATPYAADAVGYRLIFGPDSVLVNGDAVAPADSSDIYVATDDTWFFWVDYVPRAWFVHATAAIFIDANTGVYEVRDWGWFPDINGTTYFGTHIERSDPASVFYGSAPPPAPLPGIEPDLKGASVPVLAPQAGKCAILINASSVPAGDKDVDMMADAAQNALGVPAGEIQKLKNPTWAQICAAIDTANAHGCTDITFHWSGHGDPAKGVYVEKDKKWYPWKDLICKYWEADATSIRIHQESCHSGNLVTAQIAKVWAAFLAGDPFDVPDISTSADNCHPAPFSDGTNPKPGGGTYPVGSCNTTHFVACLKDSVANGAGGKRIRTWKEAHEWAKKQLRRASWGDSYRMGGDRGGRYWDTPITPAPVIYEDPPGLAQDNFPANGTLRLDAPVRFDINLTRHGGVSEAGSAHGDTLVVNGDAGNTQVFVHFLVQPGPQIDNAYLGTWLNSHPIGSDLFYIARMDTAQGQEGFGIPEPGLWMTAYHEEDPNFSGSDTDMDPLDGGPLNDIFPDDLFTSGTRVLYYFTSSYQDPDPRDPSGTSVYRYPQDPGNVFVFSSLPNAQPDTTHPCVLVVEYLEEELPLNAPQTRMSQLLQGSGVYFDVYRIQRPGFGGGGFGRPLSTTYGATVPQLLGYSGLLIGGGDPIPADFFAPGSLPFDSPIGLAYASFAFPHDGDALTGWATQGKILGQDQSIYMHGGYLALGASMTPGYGYGRFMDEWMGTVLAYDDIGQAPPGPGIAACGQLQTLPGGHFPDGPLGGTMNAWGNRPILALSPGATDPRGNLGYNVPNLNPNFPASISNQDLGSGRRFASVHDAVPLDGYRDPFSGCGSDINASQARFAAVANFLGLTFGACGDPSAATDLPDNDGKPGVKTALIGAAPTPFLSATTITYDLAEAGEVHIRVYDTAGRLVRTLIDAWSPAGEDLGVVWHGDTDRGTSAPAGLYFYRFETATASASGRLVLVR